MWIGFEFSIEADAVVVWVMDESYRELLELFRKAMQSNVLPVKDVRSLAGKLMSIARLLVAWRPFLLELWAALHCGASKAPPGMVWTRHIKHTLLWLRTFLEGRSENR